MAIFSEASVGADNVTLLVVVVFANNRNVRLTFEAVTRTTIWTVVHARAVTLIVHQFEMALGIAVIVGHFARLFAQTFL